MKETVISEFLIANWRRFWSGDLEENDGNNCFSDSQQAVHSKGLETGQTPLTSGATSVCCRDPQHERARRRDDDPDMARISDSYEFLRNSVCVRSFCFS